MSNEKGAHTRIACCTTFSSGAIFLVSRPTMGSVDRTAKKERMQERVKEEEKIYEEGEEKAASEGGG
jgi:hypothetical protein